MTSCGNIFISFFTSRWMIGFSFDGLCLISSVATKWLEMVGNFYDPQLNSFIKNCFQVESFCFPHSLFPHASRHLLLLPLIRRQWKFGNAFQLYLPLFIILQCPCQRLFQWVMPFICGEKKSYRYTISHFILTDLSLMRDN